MHDCSIQVWASFELCIAWKELWVIKCLGQNRKSTLLATREASSAMKKDQLNEELLNKPRRGTKVAELKINELKDMWRE